VTVLDAPYVSLMTKDPGISQTLVGHQDCLISFHPYVNADVTVHVVTLILRSLRLMLSQGVSVE